MTSPRERSITVNESAEIAQTPAARPSSPSRKLTMFITATIPTIVSATPTGFGRSCTPTTGNVNRCTHTPNQPAIAAAATWPPSFSHQRRPRKSSTAPTVVATAAPSRMPRISLSSGRNASAGTKIPRKSASPPSRGTPRGVERRPSSARSTTPSSRAMPPTAGVSRTTITRAIRAPQRTSRWLVSSFQTIAGVYFVP